MLKKIKNKLKAVFEESVDNKTGNGLFVTLDELMEQRQYIRYVRHYNINKSTSSRVGDVKSAFKGRGIELEEVRAYNFGDDVRDIDWRVTARKQDPYTKIYNEERDREVYVLLDLSASMVFGTKKELKSVSAAKVSALLGWLALDNKDRFGACVFDGENTYSFKPQSHQGAMIALFKKITELSSNVLKSAGEADLLKPLQILRKMVKSQAIIFIVSDFSDFNDKVKHVLASLAKDSKVFCVDIFDVLEKKPPKSGEYKVKHNNESLVFDTSSPSFRAEYARYFNDRGEEVRKFCNRFGAKYLEVSSENPLYSQLRVS